VGTEEIVITATIAERRLERGMRNLPVEVVGLGGDVSAKISPSKVHVILGGNYHWVQGINNGDVHLYADATGLPPGEHELPVQAQIDGAPPFTSVASPATVLVTIKGI
jgi:YbbR domain-containing protein